MYPIHYEFIFSKYWFICINVPLPVSLNSYNTYDVMFRQPKIKMDGLSKVFAQLKKSEDNESQFL